MSILLGHTIRAIAFVGIAGLSLTSAAAAFETQCMRDANAYATGFGWERGTPGWSQYYNQFMDENCPGGAYDWE